MANRMSTWRDMCDVVFLSKTYRKAQITSIPEVFEKKFFDAGSSEKP